MKIKITSKTDTAPAVSGDCEDAGVFHVARPRLVLVWGESEWFLSARICCLPFCRCIVVRRLEDIFAVFVFMSMRDATMNFKQFASVFSAISLCPFVCFHGSFGTVSLR